MDTSPTRKFTYFSDTPPTGFFVYGQGKNGHPAVLTVTLSVVMTLFLLHVNYVKFSTATVQGAGELSSKRSVLLPFDRPTAVRVDMVCL